MYSYRRVCVVYVFLLLSMYFYCCLCILIVVYVFLLLSMYFAIITFSHIFLGPFFYKNLVVIYVFLLEEAMYS